MRHQAARMESEPTEHRTFRSGTGTGLMWRLINRLLPAWFGVLKRYCAQESEDVPYWFNERANVSTLAAAAWLAGGIALEEFRATKDGGESFRGRSDAWLKLAGVSCLFEAKQDWPVGPDRLADAVDSGIRAAKNDLAKVSETADARLALVFMSPSLSRMEADAFKASAWEEAARAVVGAGRSDFSAGWFLVASGSIPRRARAKSSMTRDRGYPGVILFGKQVG